MSFRFLAFGFSLSSLLLAQASHAFDLSGAWASNVSECEKSFGATPSGAVFIKKDSDLYGSGFIVRGKQIIGKIAKCNILRTKKEKNVTYLIAACSTDIALSNVQFAFRIENDNEITRFYTGVPELNVS